MQIVNNFVSNNTFTEKPIAFWSFEIQTNTVILLYLANQEATPFGHQDLY